MVLSAPILMLGGSDFKSALVQIMKYALLEEPQSPDGTENCTHKQQQHCTLEPTEPAEAAGFCRAPFWLALSHAATLQNLLLRSYCFLGDLSFASWTALSANAACRRESNILLFELLGLLRSRTQDCLVGPRRPPFGSAWEVARRGGDEAQAAKAMTLEVLAAVRAAQA